MKIKFTIIDYLIIILVICAIAFAFIHITTDDSSNIQKTAFDSSTINKIPDTYLNYYKDGYIVKATVEGYNATNGEEVALNGTVKWIDETNNVKVLIESNGKTYLAGLYKNVPNADIYIDTISLETDGNIYDNLTEVTLKPMKISSVNDLRKNLTNDNYEISTTITIDSIDSEKIQEMKNLISSHDKRSSIKTSNDEINNLIIFSKSDKQNLDDANSVLGNINGLTNEITIRIYNCSDSDLDNIKNNYDIINIRNF